MLRNSKEPWDGNSLIETRVDMGMDELPNTASLPSFTAGDHKKRPKEKLTTVLKQSERLLRETSLTLRAPIMKSRERRMEKFVMSLKEERLGKSLTDDITMKKRLSAVLPEEVLNRRPRLSADNIPGDHLEILVDREGSKTTGQSRSAKIIKQAVAPKLKKAGIIRLNADLDRKIHEQHHRILEVRNISKDRVKFGDEPRGEESDEFGQSDSYGDGNEEERGKTLNLKEKTNQLEVSIKSRFINSEDEGLEMMNEQLDFSRLRSRVMPYDSEQEDDQIKSWDSPIRRLEMEDDSLSMMLSGGFPDVQENAGRAQDDGWDKDESGDKSDYSADEPDQNVDATLIPIDGYLEDEAEDEDSQVSIDEVDEEAIARELRESAFLDDDDDGNIAEGEDEDTQLALHREIQLFHDEMETEMFMNRFVPDEVLREQGVYAEIRKRYRDQEDLETEDENEYERKGLYSPKQPQTKSRFGMLKIFGVNNDEAVKSHPEFLRLLEQDRLSSSSEMEAESDHGLMSLRNFRGEERGSVQTKGFKLESTMDTFLEKSSITINTNQMAFVKRSANFSLPDEQLQHRLIPKDKEDFPGPNYMVNSKNGKRNTFETISSRPKTLKEKIGKK